VQWANLNGPDGRNVSRAAQCWMATNVAKCGELPCPEGGTDMGRLMESLLSDIEGTPAATPATLATLSGPSSRIVAESQESQGGDTGNARQQIARLLVITEEDGLPAELVHGLQDADGSACAGLPDASLRTYLQALEARDCMDSGMVPRGWGEAEARTCEGCGPVLLWATCPTDVKACPWCFRRKAGKAVPRPHVHCADCRHRLRNTVNPEAGIGGCGLDAGRAYWPMQVRTCANFAPVED